MSRGTAFACIGTGAWRRRGLDCNYLLARVGKSIYVNTVSHRTDTQLGWQKMKTGSIALTALLLFISVSPAHGAAAASPKLEAVKQYLLKEDYPERFGDTSYRMKVNNAIVADVDDDGEDDVVLHVTPHFRQSPTILIFKVSKDLKVTRVTEGLAPGPLVPISGDYLDSHTLGEAVDVDLGKDQKNPEARRLFVATALTKFASVVEYKNFIHIDHRKGKGAYVDMTVLAKPPKANNCEAFEFSMPEEVAVLPKNDGSGNYLLARVGKSIYVYKIRKIRSDGFLEKTLNVTSAK